MNDVSIDESCPCSCSKASKEFISSLTRGSFLSNLFLSVIFDGVNVELVAVEVDCWFCRRFRCRYIFRRAMYDWSVPAGGGTLDVSLFFGDGFAFCIGVPSGVFLATARNFLSIFSSSVMTQLLFMPAAAHFASRHAWHVFRDSLVISQARALAHSYRVEPVTARRKKARPERKIIN